MTTKTTTWTAPVTSASNKPGVAARMLELAGAASTEVAALDCVGVSPIGSAARFRLGGNPDDVHNVFDAMPSLFPSAPIPNNPDDWFSGLVSRAYASSTHAVKLETLSAAALAAWLRNLSDEEHLNLLLVSVRNVLYARNCPTNGSESWRPRGTMLNGRILVTLGPSKLNNDRADRLAATGRRFGVTAWARVLREPRPGDAPLDPLPLIDGDDDDGPHESGPTAPAIGGGPRTPIVAGATRSGEIVVPAAALPMHPGELCDLV